MFASLYFVQVLIMLTLLNYHFPDKFTYILIKLKAATCDFEWLSWAKVPWLETD